MEGTRGQTGSGGTEEGADDGREGGGVKERKTREGGKVGEKSLVAALKLRFEAFYFQQLPLSKAPILDLGN